MKARFVKPHTRERCVVRASTIDVFAAIKPEIQNLGMTEVGVIGFLKHLLFWWRKPPRETKLRHFDTGGFASIAATTWPLASDYLLDD